MEFVKSSPHSSKLTSNFIKTSFGNILEWYDFSLYGLFVVQISNTFFPNHNQFISILLTLLTFAIGFIARPIGGIIFGHIGDKYGKHYSVNLAVWFMVIPTVLVSIIPSYNSLGILAPVILVLLRILQGISAGGQFSGLITIAVEASIPKRSLFVGLVHAIAVLGSLIASLIGLVSLKLISFNSGYTSESLFWRIPFLFSGVLFIVYLKLRPDITIIENKGHRFSFWEIFKKQPTELFCMICMSASTGCLYYILFTYFMTFMQIHLLYSYTKALVIMNILYFISIFAYPGMGYIADKIGKRVTFGKIMTVVFLCISPLMFFVTQNVYLLLLVMLVLVVSFCSIASTMTSLYAEVFSIPYRMTSCSIAWNCGLVISGFAPMISEILVRETKFGIILMPMLISIFILYLQRKIVRSDGFIKFNKKSADSGIII
ncbi:MAG: MFS transporter [Neisseriaceae bacterium]